MLRQIIIKDLTLREGLQIPGVRVSFSDKIKILRLLDKIHIPEIEIGIPEGIQMNASIADYIYRNRLSLKTSALVPAYIPNWKTQIDRAVKYHFHKIDITIPVSNILLSDYSLYKIKKREILARLREPIEYAKSCKLEVGIGLIDASRTEINFLSYLCRKLDSLKISRVIIYDTVGVALPSLIHDLISRLRRASSTPLFVHCHNDYGLAVANSLSAIMAGAKGVEVSINGLGGRSGNAALEEVVLVLEKLYKIKTGVKLSLIQQISDLVEKTTGIRSSLLKPIIGKFSFTHSPVMHIRCVAAGNRDSFEPFKPEIIGNQRRYAFSLSIDYKKALEPFLEKLGIQLSEKESDKILKTLKQKKFSSGLTEKEIINIIKRLTR